VAPSRTQQPCRKYQAPRASTPLAYQHGICKVICYLPIGLTPSGSGSTVLIEALDSEGSQPANLCLLALGTLRRLSRFFENE